MKSEECCVIPFLPSTQHDHESKLVVKSETKSEDIRGCAVPDGNYLCNVSCLCKITQVCRLQVLNLHIERNIK